MTNEITKIEPNNAGIISSVQCQSHSDRVRLFNALNNCDFVINDEVGKEIMIKDVYIQQYITEDKDTKEPRNAYRTIIFDNEGKSHITLSTYFYANLMKLLQIWGMPDTWETPLSIRIQKRQVEKGKALTFELIDNAI